VIADDILAQVKRRYPELGADEVRKQARQAARALVICFLGVYSPKMQVLYLLPRNFDPLMKLAEIDPKYQQDVVKLIVAHELSHALQDQHMSLAALQDNANSVEKSLALSATMEGFAMFMQERVAAEMKLDDAARELGSSISTGAIKGIDPALEANLTRARGMVQGIYMSGRDFINWQYEHGGIERVWQVLAAPPIKTSMIFRPETYSTTASESAVDYAKVLAGLELRIETRKWLVTNAELGEMEVRSIYAEMESNIRDESISKLDHAQWLIATSDGCEVRIGLLVFKERSAVLPFISAVERIAVANLVRVRKSQSWQVEAGSPQNFEPMKGRSDFARKLAYVLKSQGRAVPSVFVQSAWGKAVVCVSVQGITVPDSRITSVLEEVFRRLPQGLLAAQADTSGVTLLTQ